MKKIYVSVVALVAMGAGILWWVSSVPPEKYSDDTRSPKSLSVVTTLFPLAEFARAVGGEYADVALLLPPGVEAHAFEPTPSDMVKIDRSDIFVYTGKAMEPWAEDMRKNIRESVKIVDASEGIECIPEVGEGEGHDDHIDSVDHDDYEEESGHAHDGTDPHIWLDFDNAARMVGTIERAFVERDPAHAEAYRMNADKYRKRLSETDKNYREGLSSCGTKEIVYGGHYAFGYLANRYGLSYVAAQGLAPDAEPSAKDIAALVDQIKKNDIRFVFYEELASPKIAEALARETGAKMLLLNAAHNVGKDDIMRGKTFLGIMEENLANLREGLDCR